MKKNQTNKIFFILLLFVLNFYGRTESLVFGENLTSSKNYEHSKEESDFTSENETSKKVTTNLPNVTKENYSSKKEFSSEADLGYLENSPLYFGNPTDSSSSIEEEENYLLEKTQFVISYNNKTHNPNWVAWHLSKEDLGESDRSNNFRKDTSLPSHWFAVDKNDYQFSMYGFDRGHICPSADRTSSSDANSSTFLMTNMVPQSPDNNRIVWVALEKFERELATSGYELYIFAGPYGCGGSGERGYFENIRVQKKNKEEFFINVPSHTWKIILAIEDSSNDLERVGKDSLIIAVMIPNENGIGKNKSWQNYVCSVNYIEELTGSDFFELLEDELEEELENRIWGVQ